MSFFGAAKPAAPANNTFTFGATTTQSTTGGLFGQKPIAAATPLFGASTATTTSTGGGLFGFGAKPVATAAPAFGTSTGSSLFGGFGAKPATSATPSLFGGGAPTFSGATTGSSLFAAKPAGTTGLFGSTLAPGISMFGGATAAPQQTPQQQEAQTTAVNAHVVYQSLTAPQIYSDERDEVIAALNAVQAAWGCGRAFAGQNRSVELKPQDDWAHFKTVGYIPLPQYKNEDGYVTIQFSKPRTEIVNKQKQITDAIHSYLGGQANVQVVVEKVSSCGDTATVMSLYVTSGSLRVPASDLHTALTQANIAAQLSSQLCVTGVSPLAAPSKEELRLHMATPPAGIYPSVWQQAINDNPDPQKMVPVALIGFDALSNKATEQEAITDRQRAWLNSLAEQIAQLNSKFAAQAAQTDGLAVREDTLKRRILRVITQLEMHNKHGFSVLPEEDLLRSRLEGLHSRMNKPVQLSDRVGQLGQIMYQRKTSTASHDTAGVALTPTAESEVSDFLISSQSALSALVQLVKTDLADLRLLSGLLNDIST